MSKVLFFNVPAYGHVNPTLGLVEELVKMGEEVTYFCSKEFRDQIEGAGAKYIEIGNESLKYKFTSTSIEELAIYIKKVLDNSENFFRYIASVIADEKFDYMIYDSMFPYGSMISQMLRIPSVSSFAVFVTPQEIIRTNSLNITEDSILKHPLMGEYIKKAEKLKTLLDVQMPSVVGLFFNKSMLNIAYTSKYFAGDNEYYDEKFKFIGAPIYKRKEDTKDFPFSKLKGKKVMYISLGTVFSASNIEIYNMFFKAFSGSEYVVVMSSYGVDIPQNKIPQNFIVKNYVPQTEVLKYTDVAIIHAGINTVSDLIYKEIPFVSIPFGADQFFIAERLKKLQASIYLDGNKITAEILQQSVKEVLSEKKYKENIKKIKESFEKSGGYTKAVEEIFKFKKSLNK